jgi:hypothetical protein
MTVTPTMIAAAAAAPMITHVRADRPPPAFFTRATSAYATVRGAPVLESVTEKVSSLAALMWPRNSVPSCSLT